MPSEDRGREQRASRGPRRIHGTPKAQKRQEAFSSPFQGARPASTCPRPPGPAAKEGRTWCSKPPSVRCFLTLSGNNTASQLCLPSAPRCCKGKRGSRSTVPRAPHPVLSHGGLGLGGALLLRSEMTPHRPAKAITMETRGEVPGGRLAMGPLLPQSLSPRTTPPPAALPFLGPALRKLLLTSQRSSS